MSTDPARDAVTRFGQECRRLRKANGWSLQVLGDRCRLSTATLSAIETGKTGPSLYNALAIAAALDRFVDEMTQPQQAGAVPS